MAIWLGKQYLGQTDMIKQENTNLVKVEQLLEELTKEANK